MTDSQDMSDGGFGMDASLMISDESRTMPITLTDERSIPPRERVEQTVRRAAELAIGLEKNAPAALYANGVRLATNIIEGNFRFRDEFVFPYFVEGFHDDTHRGMIETLGLLPLDESEKVFIEDSEDNQGKLVGQTDKYTIYRKSCVIFDEEAILPAMVEWRYRIVPIIIESVPE